MNKVLFACLMIPSVQGWSQQTWKLQDCINYALQNNIQIQKNRISEEQGMVNLWQDKGALFPSMSVSINQGLGFRPFEENTALVQNGQVTNTTSKATYQGSYGLNANWTVWNGGINHKNIKAQELQNEINKLTTEQSELSIQEQIAQLYVQIMYLLHTKWQAENFIRKIQSFL